MRELYYLHDEEEKLYTIRDNMTLVPSEMVFASVRSFCVVQCNFDLQTHGFICISAMIIFGSACIYRFSVDQFASVIMYDNKNMSNHVIV